MPGFDGTGPRGQGTMTGRGMGYCVVALNGAGNRLGNNGSFYGRGSRRGFRNCLYTGGLSGWMRVQRGAPAFGGLEQAVTKEEELSMLKTQADSLKNQLENMQARIQNLEEKKGAN